MTVYATDLTQLLRTVRATLAEKVGPHVPDSGALLELRMVLEQLDNLVGRTAWSPAGVQRACDLTDRLAADLGLESVEDATDTDGLIRRRAAVERDLRTTYSDGDGERIAATVAAVAEFSAADIAEQISVSMRNSLPS